MFAFVHKMCTCLCLCVSVLCLTRLSDSGSQWYCSRSMRLSPGGCSVCHAMFPCARVCLISDASECLCAWGLMCILVCVCVSDSVSVAASAHPVEALHARPFSPPSPWGAVSLPVGLGFPCNNDYLHLNHKEQENPDNCNTQRNPPPSSFRPWWNMMAGFAQLSTALAKSRHT